MKAHVRDSRFHLGPQQNTQETESWVLSESAQETQWGSEGDCLAEGTGTGRTAGDQKARSSLLGGNASSPLPSAPTWEGEGREEIP